ncbi:MAG: hypothetical protein ACTSQF_14445 [Candidatus Heimdallarchaeaceae archaeon]
MMIGFISLFVLSSVSNAVAIPPAEGSIESREGSIFIKTPYITVKLNEGKPDIFFWLTDDDPGRKDETMFHIGFYHIAEVFGDDLIVDNRDELLGGKMYNLASPLIDWTVTTENSTNEIVATQTSSVLDNGATISFVYHLYLEDIVVTQELNDTIVTYNVKGLKEIKFDIIVDNWTFSPGAAGLIFNVKVHENQYRHRIQNGDQVSQPEDAIRINNTDEFSANRTQDHTRDGVGFNDDKDNLVAYFAWTPEADIFDQDDNYLETVNVTATATSFGYDMAYGQGHAFGKEFINLQLAYPNYGDGLVLVHDPVLGINDASGVSAAWFALFAIPVLAAAALVIKRKRV